MDYYPRLIEEDMDRLLKRKEAIVLKGPRQAGKTTLLLHMRERTGAGYVTLEDTDMRDSLDRDPKAFARRFLDADRHMLFIDEAQYIKGVGQRAKLIYDLFGDDLRLVITGSGSFDMKGEIGRYMVGRAIYKELMPLGFGEFLSWRAKDLFKLFLDYNAKVKAFAGGRGRGMGIKPVFGKEFGALLEEYVLYGGYPAIVKENDAKTKAELLRNLAATYLEKDVFFFLNVRHLDKFSEFLKYLSFNNGGMFVASNVSQNLQMDHDTIESYINILTNTYILIPVSPYHRSLTTELKKPRKLYFLDTGLRNSLLNNFTGLESRTDRGALLENFILRELPTLFEGAKINYWRTAGKAEVDFVLQYNGGLVPIEAKSGETRITKGFLSFIKTYTPERAIIFTTGKFGVEKVGRTSVAFVPYFFI